jgi:Uri superfamily endonuclease
MRDREALARNVLYDYSSYVEMPMKAVRPDSRPGTYVVVSFMQASCAVTIGKLGKINFPQGYYLYVGSAFGSGGVRARTDRHLNPLATPKWHIDYLKSSCRPVELWWTHATTKMECRWSLLIAAQPGIQIPVSNLGNRDCTLCESHLYSAKRKPAFTRFCKYVDRVMPADGTLFRKVLRPHGEHARQTGH